MTEESRKTALNTVYWFVVGITSFCPEIIKDIKQRDAFIVWRSGLYKKQRG